MQIVQLITELGGFGAISRFLLGMYSQHIRAKAARERWRDQQQGKFSKSIMESIEGILEFVFAGMAVCSFVLLLSTVLLPLMFDSTQVIYMASESRSFLFFDWDKLKEYSWGSDEAAKRIVILPFQISFAANFTSFFLVGRGMRPSR